MWSHRGELGRAGIQGVDTSNIVLRVEAKGNSIKAYINGMLAIDTVLSDDEPKEGYLGLNVYSGKATFKAISDFNDKYSYNGTGNLTVVGDSKQVIKELYNKTLSNTKIDSAFYTSNGRDLIIDAAYFELLPVGTYTFKAVGSSAYEFTVNVTAVTETTLKDVEIEKGCNAIIYLGNVEVVSVTLNGTPLSNEQYHIENLMLTISNDLLTDGNNVIVINDNKTVNVTVVQ